MKKLFMTIVFASTLILCYFTGYFHGASECLTLRATTEAQAQLVTVGLIEKGKIENAIKFNEELIDGNLKIIESIKIERSNILKASSMYLSYKNSLNSNEDYILETQDKISKKFNERMGKGLTN